MSTNHSDLQAEPRNKTLGLNVSEGERRDVAFVAAFREVSQSDLLRLFVDIDAIRQEAARIRELKKVA